MSEEDKHIAIFNGKSIRRKLVGDKWFFSVVDVVGALSESSRPRKYWSDLKSKLIEEGSELSAIIGQLKFLSSDGKEYLTDCANTEAIFRIIQSIPSKKAEPFKRWLAKVGYERIQEIEDPELAQERIKEIYEKKGYSKQWIDKRLRGIAVRQDLTDEWKKRGVEEQSDFAILTAEISKASFGMTPKEYREFKGLKDENLRDHGKNSLHNFSTPAEYLSPFGDSPKPCFEFVLEQSMTDLELIFSMLGEASTTEIERTQNPEEFEEHVKVSRKGGEIAKNARRELEQETKDSVVSDENYLYEKEKDVRKKRKKKKTTINV